MKTEIIINSFDPEPNLKLTVYNNFTILHNQYISLIVFPESFQKYVEFIDSLRKECDEAMKILTTEAAKSDFMVMNSFNLRLGRE